MTTPEQPPYDPMSQTVNAPLGGGAAPAPPVRTVRKGPGWGAYLVTVIGLLILVAVIVFVLQNDQPIRVKFFSYKHDFKKSSIALGAAALAGFVAGLFLGLIPWMSARRQLRSLRRGGV
jgi:uncharacterized integral membrane protein